VEFFLSHALDDLVSDFALLDDWEERYRYVIELGRDLPSLDDAFRTASTKVNGCASQVWIYSTVGADKLNLVGDSDALIVKGLIAIAFKIFSPLTLPEIMALDADAAFDRLGLREALTPQRSNGLASMVLRIKADAAAGIAQRV
jgi:cysteine desulfuration protein SufE